MRFWRKKKLIRDGYPQSPIQIREVAFWSKADCAQMFPASESEKHRDWGVLYVEDKVGKHWSITGDPEFLKSRVVPGTERGPEGPRFFGVEFQADFHIDGIADFDARWVLYGWPDEWREIGAIYALPYVGE